MSVNLSQIAPEIREAFRAGNKARKKESAADTVESVPMDLKAAVYAWCANMKAAIKKRNADKSIPYKADDFYLPEAIWSDLETDNEFESEENIYLTGRGKNSRQKGSVAIDITRLDDDTVELDFCYERANDGQFGWLLFDGDGQNDYVKISAADLGSEKGVRIMTDVLDRCWDSMFGDRISEAFKAGNMARKKETAADTVDGIHPDFKTAMRVWCSRISDAMYERNGNHDWRNVPWHAIVHSGDRLIGFYSADVILDALDRKGVFEMIGDEENIEMESTRTGSEFKGNVWFTIYKNESAADGEYIDVTFGYERTDRQAWWDDPGTLKEGITLTIDDLISDAGVEKFFAKLDECFDKMIG